MADKTLVEDPLITFDVASSTNELDIGRSIDFAYAVNGVGFLSGSSDKYPYQRSLAQVLKQVVDNSNVPGDQSLGNYWLRSQTDWSAGAGTEFMEPITEDKIQRSFTSSYGVNVWEVGKISLLHKLSKDKTITQSSTKKTVSMTVDSGYYVGAGSKAFYLTSALVDSQVTGITAGETVNNFAYGNGYVYIATNAAIYQIDVATSKTAASKKFTVPTPGDDTRVWFVKDRLVITSGGAIWDQAAPSSGAATVALSYSSGVLYRASASSTWVGAVGTPGAVMMALAGNNGSGIYRVSLDATTPPVLKIPSSIAEFPTNETVTQISIYLGAYLIIGTTLGVRVGTLDTSGTSLSYGPLIGSPAPTGNFYAYDRFVYYPVASAGGGRSGVVRIDLSELDADGRAAWANDERLPSGDSNAVESLIVNGDGTLLCTSHDATTVAIYRTNAQYETDGFLSSSAVRLGTTEAKYFDTLKVQLQPPQVGSVKVTSIVDDTLNLELGTITSEYEANAELKIPTTDTGSHIKIEFTLNPSADGLGTPYVQSWQLRSLPALTRQRMLQVPLLCFDHERSPRGVNYGYAGYALERWRFLESAIRTGIPFTFEDFVTGETYRCVLENVAFSQESPPSNASGFGGIVELTLRTLL